MSTLPYPDRRRGVRLIGVGSSGSNARPRVDQGSAPTQASTKAQIVAWLLDHGVSFSEAALMNMSKDELLALVEAILSP